MDIAFGAPLVAVGLSLAIGFAVVLLGDRVSFPGQFKPREEEARAMVVFAGKGAAVGGLFGVAPLFFGSLMALNLQTSFLITAHGHGCLLPEGRMSPYVQLI